MKLFYKGPGNLIGDYTKGKTFLYSFVSKNNKNHNVKLTPKDTTHFSVTLDNTQELEIELFEHIPIFSANNHTTRLLVTISGIKQEMIVSNEEESGNFTVFLEGSHKQFSVENSTALKSLLSPNQSQLTHNGINALFAPMPSVINEILIEPGEKIYTDDPVIRIETMKMVITLSAPRDCFVDTIFVEEQQTVQKDHKLVTFKDSI